MFYTASATMANSSILFKIKDFKDQKYSLFILFGPYGIYRVMISVTGCYNYYNLFVNMFSENILKNLNRCLSYGASVSQLFHLGSLHLIKGYRAIVRVIGVGYKIEFVKNNQLLISLGYSHKIFVSLPNYIKIIIFKKRSIIWSYSLSQIQRFCSNLLKLKRKDVYTGKGIIQPHLKKKLKIGKISRI